MRKLIHSIMALCAVGAFSCAGSADRARPKAMTYAEASGATSCAYVEGRNEPFVVDWRADKRIDLEETMSKGLVVVSYDCQKLAVLPHCSVEGAYRFVGVTRREQLIRLESSEELRANLPLSGNAIIQRLGASLERGSTIDVAMTFIGKKTSSRPWVLQRELRGDCDGATHFVRSATLGAFAMQAGTRAKARSAADILSATVSGQGASNEVLQNRDGELEACRSSNPDGDSPPRQCSAPLRLELSSLRTAAPNAEQMEAEDLPRCPKGLVLDDSGKCATPSPSTPHICPADDPADCAIQCNKGSKASCAILGRAYMLGRGVPRDVQKARSFLEPACKQGVAPACGRLGEIAFAEKKVDEAVQLLNLACDAGWFTACETLGKVAMVVPGVKVDPFAVFQRSCKAGDPEGCWGLGSLFIVGLGVRPNDAEARRWFRLACEGGAKLGCMSYAKLVDEGRGGGEPDPAAAANLLQSPCERGYSHACGALSSYYFTGRGVRKDDAKGIELLTSACEGSDRGSCLTLAMRYTVGTNVKKDEAKARRYFTLACEAGIEPACSQVQGEGGTR